MLARITSGSAGLSAQGSGPATRLGVPRWLGTLDASDAEAALARAKRYKEAKEREEQAGAGTTPPPEPPPPSRLAAEYDEEMQAYFMSAPSGLGALAENQIRAGIKAGALDNLKGKGKPLSTEDHNAQFYRVDPLMQAMARTMGAQNVRPESLDRRDALQRQLTAFRRQVEEEVARATVHDRAERDNGAMATPSADVGTGSQAHEPPAPAQAAASETGASFFGHMWRSLGGGRPTLGAGLLSRESSRRRWSLEDLRAGRHEGLCIALAEANAAVRQYNSAVLQDKETYGSHWPLNQHPQLSLVEEVERALAEQQQGGPGGQ